MIKAVEVIVGLTPTLIARPRGGTVYLRNESAVDIYLGGSDVTTASGFLLGTGQSLPLDMRKPDDDLYGLTESETGRVRVIVTGL